MTKTIHSRFGMKLITILKDTLMYADLRNANLKNASLKGADLSNADLRNARLSGADLKDANLFNADLRDANLRDANLRDANLKSANLRDVNLSNADLSNADLREVDLGDADLSRANLTNTNLRNARLTNANLRDVNFFGANLFNADLGGARHIPKATVARLMVPSQGTIRGWKRLREGICELEIPEQAARSSATSRKCRAEFAIVRSLPDGITVGHSDYDPSFEYRLGSTVRPVEGFNEDRWDECASGIHFFITKEEAEAY